MGRSVSPTSSRVPPCVYDDATAADALEQIRRICLDLPEATERLSHGSPTFFVRDKKTFVMFLDDHHDDGRLAIWCAAPPGIQAQLVEQEPERFFRPPYVGGRGWLGVRLDVDPDWAEMAEICADAYRQVAPKSLIAELDAAPRRSQLMFRHVVMFRWTADTTPADGRAIAEGLGGLPAAIPEIRDYRFGHDVGDQRGQLRLRRRRRLRLRRRLHRCTATTRCTEP